jgi:hypothetical protein
MRLDHPHQEFMTVATDALAEWQPVDARPPADTAGGAYQVFDYPPEPGATAFLFYWPASIEITFAGYLPGEVQSQRRQLEFVTHMSRLLAQLEFPVEVHGVPGDHPFLALASGDAAARLRNVAGYIARNRGHVLIGLAEDTRRGADSDSDPEPIADSGDSDADE